MKKQIFILSLIIWCLSSALVCANVPLMPVEDIVPGMRGIAKTVIEGDTIEEFNIEVLGVIGNDAMGHNILIKASGDVIDRSVLLLRALSGVQSILMADLPSRWLSVKLLPIPSIAF